MKQKIIVFVNFLLSLVMPALWAWVLLKAQDNEIPSIVAIIIMFQIVAILIEKKKGKKKRFIARFGMISIALLGATFFPALRGELLNKSFALCTIFFYLCFFLDTASTCWKMLTSNVNRHWSQY